MSKRKYFYGDTLIEVMFAIGLLSVIIVGTILIMNGGAAKVQNSLEITMTRNEIDAEAEALRYIQSSYISERDLADSSQTYSTLWSDIKNLAVNKSSITEAKLKEILDYNPSTCADLYKTNGQALKYGFVLNYHKLNQTDVAAYKTNKDASGILLTGSKNGSSIFKAAQAYPRLLFGNKDDIYTGTNIYPNLTAAEGLYVVAIKDTGITTSVVEGGTDKTSAFIDFYIRSCWQSSASGAPTLTSTVIRLYDPDIGVVDYNATSYSLNYSDNGGVWPSGRPMAVTKQSFEKNFIVTLTSQKPTRAGYNFLGYRLDSPNYPGNEKLLVPGSKVTLTFDFPQKTVYPVWGTLVNTTAKVEDNKYGTISIESNYYGKKSGSTVTAQIPKGDKVIVNVETINKGYGFSGWYNGSTRVSTQKIYQTTVSATTTLVAKFHKTTYTVTWNPNGGSVSPTSTVKNNGEKIGTLPTPTRSNYVFKGWFTSASGGTQISSSTTPSADVTYYAHWEQLWVDKAVTIEFNSLSDLTNNGYAFGKAGTGHSQEYASQPMSFFTSKCSAKNSNLYMSAPRLDVYPMIAKNINTSKTILKSWEIRFQWGGYSSRWMEPVVRLMSTSGRQINVWPRYEHTAYSNTYAIFYKSYPSQYEGKSFVSTAWGSNIVGTAGSMASINAWHIIKLTNTGGTTWSASLDGTVLGTVDLSGNVYYVEVNLLHGWWQERYSPLIIDYIKEEYKSLGG